MNSDPKYQPGEPPTDESLSGNVVVSSDTKRGERIPPGQVRTRKWPVLHASTVPEVDTATWRLKVTGLVDNELEFDWQQYRELPRVRVFADFHCVTTWSRLGNLWEGVSVHELMRMCGVQSAAKFVVAAGYDGGWTTNLPLSDFSQPDVLLADTHDEVQIDADHGGPVRLMVPLLYAWKSAKWLKEIRFVAEDEPGYWESVGYHMHGDPWTEERHRDDPAWRNQ